MTTFNYTSIERVKRENVLVFKKVFCVVQFQVGKNACIEESEHKYTKILRMVASGRSMVFFPFLHLCTVYISKCFHYKCIIL